MMKRIYMMVGWCLSSMCLAGTSDGIVPGTVWPDDNGVHINAHGGGILFHEGTYYWFGEHKIEGAAGNRAQVGVHVYASKDLCKWTDRGVALSVDDDPDSEITKGCILERPKVVYNAKTGKFVMWFHLEHLGAKPQPYSTARSAVAVADHVAGPYRFLHSLRAMPTIWPENFPAELRNRFDAPDSYYTSSASWQEKAETHQRGLAVNTCFHAGQMSRDQTVFVDDDGTAYHIAASEHNATLHIRELDTTYTTYSGRYIRVFPGRFHEAPAVFKRKGKYYMVTSGCTGWAPNAARSMVADSMMGEWRELGNPCKGINPRNGLGAEKTFGGQSTFVLPVQGRQDAYIAMFDLWQPKNAIDGRYVWLPVEFEGDSFFIHWKDEWNLGVFD
ncbi:glycoside hydrolase family 43 protein [Pontiellaceae bacterium B12227]|nr:glycoside hydrolase family 43 protein [Pontiellaceae bacterium B12227]